MSVTVLNIAYRQLLMRLKDPLDVYKIIADY